MSLLSKPPDRPGLFCRIRRRVLKWRARLRGDHTCEDASQSALRIYHLAFLLPFLRQQYESKEGRRFWRPSKRNGASFCYCSIPTATDGQVRETVDTTEKQMKRWSQFQAARAAQSHYRNRREGWY